MHAGIRLTPIQDGYTQKCTAFMPPGPTLMQMSTGLAFGPVAHEHGHFCVRRRDIYLVTRSLHIFNFIFILIPYLFLNLESYFQTKVEFIVNLIFYSLFFIPFFFIIILLLFQSEMRGDRK